MAINILYEDETLSLVIRVQDADETLFAPDSIAVAAIAPSGEEYIHLESDSPETIFTSETGIYKTYFDADEIGTWGIEVKTVYSQNGIDIVDYARAEFVVYEKLSTL